MGRPIYSMSCELVLVAGRPCDLPGCAASARSVGVVSPTAPVNDGRRGNATGDWDRYPPNLWRVVFWEDGQLRPAGRIGMTRSGLEGFGRTLRKDDEVVIEATGKAMAVVRVLSPYVARVIVANPLQVKAIAHSRIKTDTIDAGVLASLRAADFLPEIWLPDADTERLRRLVARRNQVVRHRTRIKNEVHAILHAHLIPPCPHADLFGGLGRAWLGNQPLPQDEQKAIERHLRELDRLGEDLSGLDRDIAQAAIDDPAVKRLLTIAGINLTVAVGLKAATGDVRRFASCNSLDLI